MEIMVSAFLVQPPRTAFRLIYIMSLALTRWLAYDEVKELKHLIKQSFMNLRQIFTHAANGIVHARAQAQAALIAGGLGRGQRAFNAACRQGCVRAH